MAIILYNLIFILNLWGLFSLLNAIVLIYVFTGFRFYMLFLGFAFLKILRIFGAFIGFVFLLILLITAIVLFIPFKYRINIQGDNKNFNTDYYVSWFFKLIQIHKTNIENTTTTVIKLLGIDKNKIRLFKPSKNAEKQESDEKKINAGESLEQKITLSDHITEPDKTTYKSAMSEEIDADNNFHTEKESSIFDKIQAIIEKVGYYKNYPQRDEIVRLTLNLVQKFYHKNKPDSITILGEIGFSSPNMTGNFLGILSIIKSFLRLNIHIDGNFEKEIFQMSLKAKGSLTLWQVFWPITKYVFKKPIWKIVKKSLNKNKHEKEEVSLKNKRERNEKVYV